MFSAGATVHSNASLHFAGHRKIGVEINIIRIIAFASDAIASPAGRFVVFRKGDAGKDILIQTLISLLLFKPLAFL